MREIRFEQPQPLFQQELRYQSDLSFKPCDHSLLLFLKMTTTMLACMLTLLLVLATAATTPHHECHAQALHRPCDNDHANAVDGEVKAATAELNPGSESTMNMTTNTTNDATPTPAKAFAVSTKAMFSSSAAANTNDGPIRQALKSASEQIQGLAQPGQLQTAVQSITEGLRSASEQVQGLAQSEQLQTAVQSVTEGLKSASEQVQGLLQSEQLQTAAQSAIKQISESVTTLTQSLQQRGGSGDGLLAKKVEMKKNVLARAGLGGQQP